VARRLSLLIVEDSETDTELVVLELRRHGYDVAFERVDSSAELSAALESQRWDLVLCDHGLPSFELREALAIVRARGADLPFVILSGTIGEEAAVEALKGGARDVVLKTNLPRLGPVVDRELQEAANRRRHRQAEQALRDSEARKSAILESALDCVITIDHEGRIIDFNPAAERTFGYERGEVAGKPMAELIIPPSLRARHREAFARYLATGASAIIGGRIELTGMRADGSEFPVELSITRGDLSGQPFFTAYLRDITERKRAGEERARLAKGLIQSQKMEAVGRLASGVAHDFNNLLSVTVGFAEILARRALPAEEVSSYAEQIRTAGNHGAALVKRMLAFSRQQEFEPRAIDLNELVRGTEQMLRSLIGEAVELVIDVPSGLGFVMADPVQLEQVLLNLATNARDAMPSGGRLAIRAARGSLPTAGQLPPGSYLRLTVSDTGLGMDKATLQRIFEPFFTTKPLGVGTGLGLSSVYGIVEQSGGTIEVESVPGAGTIFHIYLPEAVGGKPEGGSGETSRAPEPAPGPATILVVDDDAGLRALVSLLVAEAGYRVLAAGSPAEALGLASQERFPIELLLTDVVMPGMSGPELAKRLASQRPGLRVLYMSGYEDKTVVERTGRRRADDLLAKPFTPDDLLARVEAAIGEVSPTGPDGSAEGAEGDAADGDDLSG
jgi:hypothetical protein